ncbi:MAG: DUF4367 domain-containing protein [Chloroflexales bacterium]|nr:DUF4367 domain-containing protein [Chloroflexales bacterium]
MVPHFDVTSDKRGVSWRASSPTKGLCQDGDLRLYQEQIVRTGQNSALSIGDAPAQAVTVAGQPAALIEQTQESMCTERDKDGTLVQTVIVTRNVLVWEQDDIRYTLTSGSQLPSNELRKTAEGLRD